MLREVTFFLNKMAENLLQITANNENLSDFKNDDLYIGLAIKWVCHEFYETTALHLPTQC
jgi:hypothetical protein